MIAYVQGKFVQKTPAQVVVDVNGVGYELHISLNTYSKIEGLEQGLLYTSVSGVGAATARMMLSSLKPEELVRAIVQGNTKQLEAIKGIGRKSAERIILELREKMAKITPISNISPLIDNTLEQDALNALIALGIGRSAGEQALQRVLKAEPELNRVEDIIKKALKSI
jgi:holliday junction DNA helicase RuvA